MTLGARRDAYLEFAANNLEFRGSGAKLSWSESDFLISVYTNLRVRWHRESDPQTVRLTISAHQE